jgi:hypothetical protein
MIPGVAEPECGYCNGKRATIAEERKVVTAKGTVVTVREYRPCVYCQSKEQL